MTDTQTETPTPQSGDAAVRDLANDKALVAVVSKSMEQVVGGKITLSDLFSTVVGDGRLPEVTKAPPVPKPLTEAQLAALKRLPDVFASVIVQADRKLSAAEVKALVEERDTIDEIIGVLEKRKSESIREVLANHLDHLVTDDQKESARLDGKGHYAVKQDVSVEGTGKKVQRSVAGGKPKLGIANIEALHEEGLIDRPTYLKITKVPPHKRIMDEAGLHAAIQKDPRLFFLLASEAEPTAPTTTIKVVKDS